VAASQIAPDPQATPPCAAQPGTHAPVSQIASGGVQSPSVLQEVADCMDAQLAPAGLHVVVLVVVDLVSVVAGAGPEIGTQRDETQTSANRQSPAVVHVPAAG
jgi:hypothetical protein